MVAVNDTYEVWMIKVSITGSLKTTRRKHLKFPLGFSSGIYYALNAIYYGS